MSLVCPPAAMSDPERPADGHYRQLDYVPWFARMRAAQRLQYLGWRVAALKAQLAQWRAAHPNADCADMVCDPAPSRIAEELRSVEGRGRIEVDDQGPLDPPHRGPNRYAAYLDSPRWRRKRLRKFVAVSSRCEFPGCGGWAEECHHRHYRTLGFEENGDLEALCRLHHEARHGLIRAPRLRSA